MSEEIILSKKDAERLFEAVEVIKKELKNLKNPTININIENLSNSDPQELANKIKMTIEKLRK